MADGALNVLFSGPLAEEVRAAAEARGVSPEEYVRDAVAEGLVANDQADMSLDWDDDLRRLAEPGENAPLDQAFDRFKIGIAAARAKPE